MKLRVLLLAFVLGGALAVFTSGEMSPYAHAVDLARIAEDAATQAGGAGRLDPRGQSGWHVSLPGFHRAHKAATIEVDCSLERFRELVSQTQWMLEELAVSSGVRVLAAHGGANRWRMVYEHRGILGTVEVQGSPVARSPKGSAFLLEMDLEESR